ncbi:2-oxoacid:acceptor oxidoreductase family protein [Thermoanaerobacter sp. CM-CNRG TB177]|jgi:2-oxoglutarate ferredoxin oxidoreductase subunit gamma|uniref:Pyruvate/ketoisovalerate oxidoreductase, gamma subunit n=2 Tax=Thermoanaerobacter TaxID=1754 RepID=B0K9J4_THEP3|nr:MULTISPECIES: 2-oxoacid:acceptor oxidoreductase family protein [Thermoanaerobacter]KUJ91561.1 MAG: pyruvate/ketoisovalerate oxidoreductase subunit gamma [Thermoanaerobacter thermocopriae]KUK34645.1 MAG: Pyruvate/ketoisovalerate oxidoreductase, gamma subunit [Caldanaerobacter subterraneus]ABY92876.1 pyruvate/ketoisovalerate oxidoreductase, gamma subunit [Thermoanaerobacter sp. X514]ABY94807.1 pyruvate/ketoisovalerate oxidoreductase, gamma subunit [Thermoanaerobacter pseudethanolicus ATCC 3322
MSSIEIRLGGSGGQGLILAGIILAEAAILDGKNSVQSQSYGPEARGGSSKAEVIISNEYITYPKVLKPDILLTLASSAYLCYKNDMKENGIIIIDESIIPNDEDTQKVVRLPIIKTAQEIIGRAFVANIISLGVIAELTNVVTKESLERAVLNRVPPATEEINKRALREGYNLVKMRGSEIWQKQMI